jgi:putative transposase
MSWSDFIRAHMAVLAGMDFFTAEVLTWRGLATYYVLFFLHLETRRVTLAGITQYPTEEWMMQMARRAVDAIDGTLRSTRFVLHDRDSKFCASFRNTLRSAGIQPLRLPARSPNLNAFAERWVRSIRGECLSRLVLFGEASLRRAVTHFIDHYHLERPHQGRGNQLLFRSPVSPPSPHAGCTSGPIQCHELLGGLLKFYQRAA